MVIQVAGVMKRAKLNDKYELTGVIGKGLSSIVYEAINLKTKAKVAVKLSSGNKYHLRKEP